MIHTNEQQSRYLLELGLDKNTADMVMFYDENKVPNVCIKRSNIFNDEIPIWSTHKLLDMMPSTIHHSEDTYHFEMLKGKKGYTICYGLVNDNNDLIYCVIITELDLLTCVYNMVVWLLKNKYI